MVKIILYSLIIILSLNNILINSQVASNTSSTTKAATTSSDKLIARIVKLNSTKKIINVPDENKKCNLYMLNPSFNKLGFHIKKLVNISKIVITDKHPGSNCGSCDSEAEICQISYVDSDSSIALAQYVNFFSRVCLKKIYIIVSNNNVMDSSNEESEEHSFEIDSTFYNNEPCLYKEESHLHYCGQSPIEDCRSCKRQGCTIVECGNYSNDQFISHYEICLNNSIKSDEKQAICQEFNGVTSFNNSTPTCTFDDLEGYSFMSIFLVFVLVCAVILFSVIVVYYNVYLMKYNDLPFEPPTYFPIFLFPRETEIMKEENKRQAENLGKVFKQNNDYESN